MKVLFFGSTTDSVIVLEQLAAVNSVYIAAVVTQPARPIGRNQTITPTPVEVWAQRHSIAVLTFENNPEKPWLYINEQHVIDALQPIQADILVSASYGIKIPWSTIKDARRGGINVHPSLLPRWRGGDPVPWAILSGDHQIGVTIVSLAERFDEGLIFAQKKIPILPTDTSGALRTRLFTIGAETLAALLPDYIQEKIKGNPQKKSTEPVAKRFSRETGFEPWPFAESDAKRIERKYRALHPWPGVWTLWNNKRLKILALHLDNETLVLDQVQMEGKKSVSWKQFKTSHLPS